MSETQDFVKEGTEADGIEVLTLRLPVSVDQIGKASAEQVESVARDAATAVRAACKRRGWGVS
jgi:hypothetical protein